MADAPHREYKFSGKTVAASTEERTQTQIRLRKENRIEELNKKRLMTEPPASATAAAAAAAMPLHLLEEVRARQDVDVESLTPAIMNDFDRDSQLAAVHKCRTLLSRQTNPPVDLVIKAGIVPKAIELLYVQNRPDLQFQAAWLLTNILSGTTEQTLFVVNCGAIPALMGLLSSPSIDAREQAIWALANIAGENADLRDNLISLGLAPIVVHAINTEQRQTLVRQAVWLLSNLCRPHGRPSDPHVLLSFVPLLVPLIQRTFKTDTVLCTDALWAVNYIADRTAHKIEALLAAGVASVLVMVLQASSEGDLLVACLKAANTMQTGSPLHAQPFIDAGILMIVKELFSKKTRVCQLALVFLTTLCTISPDHIMLVLRSCLPSILALCRGPIDVALEALNVLSTAVTRGTTEQALFVSSSGAVPLMVARLVDSTKSTNPTALLKALARLLAIGRADGEKNAIATIVEEANGVDVLESLEMSQHQGVSACAEAILREYFPREHDGIDDGGLPSIAPPSWSSAATSDLAPFEF